MDDDYRLLRQIQEGDERALSELMENHKEPVFHFAYRYTGNYAEACEIAEETFVKVYFSASSFAPRGKIKTWIFAIAANLARDYLRRRKKRRDSRSLDESIDREGDVSLAEITASTERTSAQVAVETEDLQTIEEAIQALPHKLRFPFVFCILEGNSYEECARVLGSSVKSIDSRIYRARQKLRDALLHLRR